MAKKAKKSRKSRAKENDIVSTGQLFNFAPNSYLERTSRPIYAIWFLLPFIVFYEVGTILINTNVLNQSVIRVVAFVWLQDFLSYQSKKTEQSTSEIHSSEDGGEIRIGLGSCCIASGSSKVKETLENTLRETGIRTQVKRVGCVGMSHRAPLLEVILPDKEAVLYDKVRPEEVKRIILSHYRPESLQKRLTNAAAGFLENISRTGV